MRSWFVSQKPWCPLLLSASLACFPTACRKSSPAKEPPAQAKQDEAMVKDAPRSPSKPVSEPEPAPVQAVVRDEPKAAPQDAQKDPPKATPPANRPLYYAREVTDEDLEGRTLREFSLLRNTIYARAGNKFRKTWLDQHFRALDWYKPSDKMRKGDLTSQDRDNVTLIVMAEQAIPKEKLDKAREELLAKSKLSSHERIELRLLSARLGKWSDKIKDSKRTPLEDISLLDKLLKLRNLEEMSRRDLRILRNTIYARKGRKFDSELVSSYFYDKDWYRPNDAFKSSMLSAVDKKNIRIVLSLEHSLGGPIRDADHPEADWMYVA